MAGCSAITLFFFFNDTATTEIYTLSLHDALPISASSPRPRRGREAGTPRSPPPVRDRRPGCRAGMRGRSEEHTSELQSRSDLVCRLLLEKKKTQRSSIGPVLSILRDGPHLVEVLL